MGGGSLDTLARLISPPTMGTPSLPLDLADDGTLRSPQLAQRSDGVGYGVGDGDHPG